MIISLCDKSIATSGNYRNFYIKDGKNTPIPLIRTLDTLHNKIFWCNRYADDCMTADAYATAFMTMGLEQSKELASKLPGLHYYFIYENEDGGYGIEQSDGFDQYIAH